ncbi:M17 family peptidase N-terminal domain-containing protein, partial [Streptomyces pathocidini]|uniref:M17 family peptidase N-terminal domain-containing protein n=1 Tax=Streptomyces pathocidini TaxID=1650571 RepID=UPI000A9CAC32
MTALTLSTSTAASLRADAVVIGVAKGDKGPVVASGGEAVDKAFGGKLATVLETLGASGGEGEVTKLPAPAGFKAPVVLAVGLGEPPAKGEPYGAEALRRAAGAAARAQRLRTVRLALGRGRPASDRQHDRGLAAG